jgi:hypothetical protein
MSAAGDARPPATRSGGGQQLLAGGGVDLPGGGDAEVHHLHVAAGGEHDVAGLDVPVDDPAAVGHVQAVGHGGGDPRRLHRRDGAAAAQPAGQRLPLQQLQDQERRLAVHEVEHPGDIRVGQLGGGACLLAEAPHRRPVAGQLLGQHLDRDPPAEQGVVGLPDLAHAAGIDPPHRPVAAILAERLPHRLVPSPVRGGLSSERPSNHAPRLGLGGIG